MILDIVAIACLTRKFQKPSVDEYFAPNKKDPQCKSN
jgi:hypothetical protein